MQSRPALDAFRHQILDGCPISVGEVPQAEICSQPFCVFMPCRTAQWVVDKEWRGDLQLFADAYNDAPRDELKIVREPSGQSHATQQQGKADAVVCTAA